MYEISREKVVDVYSRLYEQTKHDVKEKLYVNGCNTLKDYDVQLLQNAFLLVQQIELVKWDN